MRAYLSAFAVVSCGFACSIACSSSDSPGTPNGTAGMGNGSAGQGAAGTTNPGGGSAGQAQGTAGRVAQGGDSGGANPSAGAGGASAGAGNAGAAGAPAGAGSGGVDPLDTLPWRMLNVTVGGSKQITHNGVGGLQSAGLDTRAKQLGKLVVDLGVSSGGYQPWLGKRGFHSIGVSFPMCGSINDWDKGRDYDGDCRLNTFDGKTHGTQSTVNEASSIATKVKNGLTALHMQFPTEDWGYFLNQDGSVRWSDVAFTGMSHGATTAPVIGHAVRLYRVVSRSGPRDTTCGIDGFAKSDFDRNNLPWEANCPDKTVASWLDAPTATPVDRYYAFVGKMDTEYGDIMYSMERQKFIGEPVRWDVAGTVLTNTHRYYADAGHLDFLSAAANDKPARTDEAMEIAFGVPVTNRNPAF